MTNEAKSHAPCKDWETKKVAGSFTGSCLVCSEYQ